MSSLEILLRVMETGLLNRSEVSRVAYSYRYGSHNRKYLQRKIDNGTLTEEDAEEVMSALKEKGIILI